MKSTTTTSTTLTTSTTINGVPVELREPTLDDVVTLEANIKRAGYENLGDVPSSELQLQLFVVLCVQFGDEPGVTRDQLRSMPMKAFKEVSEAVAKFRDSIGM